MSFLQQDWELTKGSVPWASAVRRWAEMQDGQRILLTTPSVLVGFRVEVYRAEGTTQWYTAVIVGYNESTKVRSAASPPMPFSLPIVPSTESTHLAPGQIPWSSKFHARSPRSSIGHRHVDRHGWDRGIKPYVLTSSQSIDWNDL